MRELDAAHVESFLDAQQATVDQLRERIGRRARRRQRLRDPLLGQALAVAGLGQQLVLDDAPHARGLVGERALVEFGEDRVARARQQIGRDLAAPCASRTVLSSRQTRLSSDGSTSAFASSAPPATNRTIDSATSCDTRRPPGCMTALSACAPVMRASRMRFCVIEGMMPFTLSRCAR